MDGWNERNGTERNGTERDDEREEVFGAASVDAAHVVDEPGLAVAAQAHLRVDELAVAAHPQRDVGAIALERDRALHHLERSVLERRERVADRAGGIAVAFLEALGAA